jgi:hypothetical protein
MRMFSQPWPMRTSREGDRRPAIAHLCVAARIRPRPTSRALTPRAREHPKPRAAFGDAARRATAALVTSSGRVAAREQPLSREPYAAIAVVTALPRAPPRVGRVTGWVARRGARAEARVAARAWRLDATVLARSAVVAWQMGRRIALGVCGRGVRRARCGLLSPSTRERHDEERAEQTEHVRHL